MKTNYNKKSKLHLLTKIVGFIVLTFAAIVIISSLQVKVFQSQSLEQLTKSGTFTNIFLHMLGDQIPQFEDTFSDELSTPSLSNVAIESLTGIKIDNLATSFLQEIPGVHLAKSGRYIAGEKVNDGDMPQESPPPNFDELLAGEDPNEDEESAPDNKNKKNPANPSVYIYHSHSWEGFLPLIEEDVKPSVSSSVDNDENVVLVGSMLTEQLEHYGISTFHNKVNMGQALHDKGWDSDNSYDLTREFVQTAVAQHKSMEYFIDIHRDAARKDKTTATINGKKYAKLYFVVGVEHENYENNLAFAKKINEKLEAKYPGISRGIYPKSKFEGNGVYNQDISNHSLLIEMGGVDNTKEELKNTVDAFAKVFNEIYDGAIEVNAQ
ncbi:stage II sporulation protein P [Virgibacillus dakarensis]|nr:stage II sporulation protein P [Virgibacillus dakarensis]